MVATPTRDRLNTIFIKDIGNRDLEEDGSIRVQRLNVGFSRAKECMHFVLSKPVAEFKDEIGNAIKHYSKTLEDIKKGPDVSDVDPKSPKEKEVLQWIRETEFYVTNSDNIELKAQFSVGDYLKQISPFYQHPSYKSDFLLTYKDRDNHYYQIIIEYDGFEHHFRNKDEVNELNYQYYYTDEDVYREKVLESYGYLFLRINKFNLGANPVQTLSNRLKQLTQKKSLRI
jgi:very-short-patch-repair endonuclease